MSFIPKAAGMLVSPVAAAAGAFGGGKSAPAVPANPNTPGAVADRTAAIRRGRGSQSLSV